MKKILIASIAAASTQIAVAADTTQQAAEQKVVRGAPTTSTVVTSVQNSTQKIASIQVTPPSAAASGGNKRQAPKAIAVNSSNVNTIIQGGTSSEVFQKNIALAGICEPEKNPNSKSADLATLRLITEKSKSMKQCLGDQDESIAGKDLYCELTHVQRIPEEFQLKYLVATEQKRVNDCGWNSTEQGKLFSAMKQAVQAYINTPASSQNKQINRDLLIESLLEYITSFDASDMAGLSGYGYLQEYLSSRYQGRDKKTGNTTLNYSEAEMGIYGEFFRSLSFVVELSDWRSYIRAKKFSPEITQEYMFVLDAIETFRDSPTQLETYKAALEALGKKYRTSREEMQNLTQELQPVKKADRSK